MHKLNYRALDFEGEVLECPWVCRGCLRRSTSCGCPEGFPAWLDSDVGQARQSLLGRYNCRAGPAECGFCRRGPGHLILLGEWARDVQAIRDGKPPPSSQATVLPEKAAGALMGGERAAIPDRLAPARAARAANALLRRQREQQLRRGGGGGGGRMLDEDAMGDEDGGADGDLYARDYRFRGGGTRKRGRRDLYDDTVVAPPPGPSRPRGPGRPRLSERRVVPLGGSGSGGVNGYGGEMRPSWSSTVEVRLGFTGRRFVRLKLDNCPRPEKTGASATTAATRQVV